MAGSPLAKFFATVGFKFDTEGLNSQVKKIKQDLENITGNVRSSPVVKKMTAAQKAADKVKTESKLLEASKIKSLRLIEDNASKKIGMDAKHSEERKKLTLAEKKSAQKLADWNNQLSVARKKLNLQEKANAIKSVKDKAELNNFTKKVAAQEKLDKSKMSVLQKKVLLTQKETLKQDAITSRLKQQGQYKQLAAETYERTVRSKVQEIQARTAGTEARAAQAKIRNEGLLHSLGLQNARNEGLRIRSAMQAKAAEVRHAASLRMNSSGVMTGGVGGLTARGALGSLGAAGFGMSSFKVGQFSLSRQPQFEFITGSAEEAKRQIDFVDKEVNRLSLNLIEANTQYKNLLATGASTLGIENTQKLFTNFQNLSTMLGLSTDAQNRALRAFSQMSSKGSIMAEELKGQ